MGAPVLLVRLIAAGVNMITWIAVGSEWQRDWARLDTAALLPEILIAHCGGSGVAYMWEQQLLNTPVGAAG